MMTKRLQEVGICLTFLFLAPSLMASPQSDILKGRPGETPSAPAEEPRKVKPKDHWTPYYPPDPATLHPDVQVHYVRQGDTLWSIAQQWLGDGRLWPQIWEVNKYITHAHWIYPGDPVAIPQPLLVAEVEEEPAIGVIEMPEEIKPPTMATLADVNCSFYFQKVKKRGWHIVDPEDEEAAKIIAAEETKVGLGEGDVVYINRGELDGVMPGDEYFIVRKGNLVFHPKTTALIGRQMDLVGRLIVMATQENTSTAKIDQACDAASLEDLLRPFSQIPIPLASGYMRTSKYWTKPSGKKQGYIISSRDGVVACSTGVLVGIDLGSTDGVEPGDFLTVFRPNPMGKGLPRIVLGDLVVLTVGDDTATTKIVNSFDAIMAGDQVELK